MIKGFIGFLIIIGIIMFLVAGQTTEYVVVNSGSIHPHLFGIADTTQSLLVVGEFQAVDFNFLLGDAYLFTSQDSNCIVVEQEGHYKVDFEVFFQDNSPVATSIVAIIITKNGAEIPGSYAEVNFIRQYANLELSTFAYVEADVNDVLCMEWTGSEATASLTGLNTYSNQSIVAKGFINWVHA